MQSMKELLKSKIQETLKNIEEYKEVDLSLPKEEDFFTSILTNCKDDMVSIVEKCESGEITQENVLKTVKDCLDSYTLAAWLIGSKKEAGSELFEIVDSRNEKIEAFCNMLFGEAKSVNKELRLSIWRDIARELALGIEPVYRRAKDVR